MIWLSQYRHCFILKRSFSLYFSFHFNGMSFPFVCFIGPTFNPICLAFFQSLPRLSKNLFEATDCNFFSLSAYSNFILLFFGCVNNLPFFCCRSLLLSWNLWKLSNPIWDYHLFSSMLLFFQLWCLEILSKLFNLFMSIVYFDFKNSKYV